jgi:hypothetical protein
MDNFGARVAAGIVDGLVSGRFSALLTDHCLQWRDNNSHYAVQFAIRHLIDRRDGDNAFALKSDGVFRKRKRETIG